MKTSYVSIAILLLAPVASASAASFDCGKAATPDEKAVCADPQLSALDSVAGRAFAAAMKQPNPDDRDKVRSVAVQFLRDRRQCDTERRCIIAHYLDALTYYGRFGDDLTLPSWLTAPLLAGGEAPVTSAPPGDLGHCTATVVKMVNVRLIGAGVDGGTIVEFANGASQVSYATEPAARASRSGDKAVMCLAAMPKFCPPGDDRGKFYLVTNLRTGGTWSLPDSQHLCGGA